MLENILSSLNLDEQEVKTYLLLLEIGPVTVGNLSKKMGIARSSLYGFLKRLQDLGLAVQYVKNNVKVFSAESPEKINLLFEQKIEELQKKQELYKTSIPELHRLQPTKFIAPKMQVFEGEEGLKSLMKDILLYSDIEGATLWPIEKMVEVLSPDFFHYYNKRRISNNIYLRALWPQNQLVEIKKHPYLGTGEKFKREIRIAPPEIDFTMGHSIYGNKVAFISSRKESIGFIIESAELAQMLLAQFEFIWKASKKLEVNEADTETFIKELR
ncbi:MAG: helix-turn-helix domain-containing protein [Patescibacteria group bacterium]